MSPMEGIKTGSTKDCAGFWVNSLNLIYWKIGTCLCFAANRFRTFGNPKSLAHQHSLWVLFDVAENLRIESQCQRKYKASRLVQIWSQFTRCCAFWTQSYNSENHSIRQVPPHSKGVVPQIHATSAVQPCSVTIRPPQDFFLKCHSPRKSGLFESLRLGVRVWPLRQTLLFIRFRAKMSHSIRSNTVHCTDPEIIAELCAWRKDGENSTEFISFSLTVQVQV